MRKFALATFAVCLGVPAAFAQPAPNGTPPPERDGNAASLIPRLPALDVPPPLPAPAAGPAEAPPPVPKAEAPRFFIIEKGASVGPMSLEQVRQAVRAGKITRKTGVWKAGTPKAWADAEKLPELAALFPPAPPPRDLSREYRSFLAPGVWAVQVNNPALNSATRTVLRYSEDGRFVGTISTSLTSGPQMPPYITAVSGTWEVQGIDDHRFSLTLNPEQGQPNTAKLSVIDRNHVRDETSNAIATRVVR